ncbi:MAG: prenyltransferase/squalene oxidase repeat-containing protein, partial [Thermodesulfovibrionales bacterium]
MARGVLALVVGQEADGSWRVPLESDASVTAFALLLRQYLGRLPDTETLRDFVSYLRATQSADGGWQLYPGGPDNPDASVLVYTALKVCGVPSGDPVLMAARRSISRMGGLDSICQPARTLLALLGQLPVAHLPYGSVRLLHEQQGRHPFLDLMGILALGSVVMMRLGTSAAVRPLPESLYLSELRADNPSRQGRVGSMEIVDIPPQGFRCGRISRFFWSMNRILDRRLPVSDADSRADQWLLRQQGKDGVFAGMLLPTGFALAALDQLPGEHEAVINRGLEGWSFFEARDRRGGWYQFSLASAHDTAQALRALWEYSEDASLQPALRAKEFLVSQFQAVTVEGSGGWTFGSSGYPDADTTAIVLWALLPFQALHQTVVARGVDWLLQMQSYNGGWAPYSAVTGPVAKLIASGLFTGYADLPDVDVTARVLRVLG